MITYFTMTLSKAWRLGCVFFRKAQKCTKIGKFLTVFGKGTYILVTITLMKVLQYALLQGILKGLPECDTINTFLWAGSQKLIKEIYYQIYWEGFLVSDVLYVFMSFMYFTKYLPPAIAMHLMWSASIKEKKYWSNKSFNCHASQLILTCSKPTIETLEKGVKYV